MLIKINNKIEVTGLPIKISRIVTKELSFPNPLYQSAIKHNRMVRGIPKLIKSYYKEGKKIIIERGYLSRLLELTEKLEKQIIWETVKLKATPTSKNIKLWDYQTPWVNRLLSSHQGVGIAPPGSGKTLMALKIYEKLGQSCLWITHTKRLAVQTANRAQEFLGVEAGIIGMGKKDNIRHFTIGIVSTLVRRDLSQYTNKFGLILCDECHHVPASSFTTVISSFPAHYRYGVTATPYRDDKLEPLIFHSLGPSASFLDKEELREKGHLMTPSVIRRPTKFYFPYNPMVRKRNYQALQDALPNSDERNKQIIGDVVVEATSGSNVCIVLVGRISHGEYLYDCLKQILPNVGLVHSKMKTKESDQVLDDFEEGRLTILIATYKMLAEGFDYKPSNRLFLTAPFKGRTLIEQACGRIERVCPEKKTAIIFDYVDEKIGVLENQASLRKEIYLQNNNPILK